MNDYKEIKPDHIGVYPNTCIGCQNTQTDLMLSFLQGAQITDVFLTADQAAIFKVQIESALARNRQPE